MDTEEMIRTAPMDAVVLIGGCDKTVPAQLMGAISADTPAIQLVVGPMVTGSHRGTRVGACTDCRGYWGRFRAGEIDIEEIGMVGNELVPSSGVRIVSMPLTLDMRSNGYSVYNGVYHRSSRYIALRISVSSSKRISAPARG